MIDHIPKSGPEQFPPGADIIRQGELPDKFYIITRGTVQILDQPPDSLDVVINQLQAGDFFGEVGLIKKTRRMATVRAVTHVEVMAMDYDIFKQWLDGEPDIGREISEVAEQRAQKGGLLEPLEDAEGILETTKAGAFPRDNEMPQGDSATQFKAGQVIIQQGDLPDYFYILLEGTVKVLHTNNKGRTRLVTHLQSGDYFGEIGLLQATPRIATVQAETDVKLLSFDRETFRRWMLRSPSSKEDIAQTAARRRQDTGLLNLSDDESAA